MWVDELALARNVEDRGLVGLVSRPLDHYQVAPVGTLVLLEASSTLLGVSEGGSGLALGSWASPPCSSSGAWRRDSPKALLSSRPSLCSRSARPSFGTARA
jgi:hypothetical protein